MADPVFATAFVAGPPDPPPPSDSEIDTGLQSPDHYEAPWTTCVFISSLERDEGLRPMPIASADGGNRGVQVTGPHTLYILEWTATRRGKLPLLPSPTPPTTNMKLLKARIVSRGVELVEDIRTPEYTVAGVYTFLLLDNKWIEDGIQIPLYPWTTLTKDTTVSIQPIDSGSITKPTSVLGTAHFKTGMY